MPLKDDGVIALRLHLPGRAPQKKKPAVFKRGAGYELLQSAAQQPGQGFRVAAVWFSGFFSLVAASGARSNSTAVR